MANGYGALQKLESLRLEFKLHMYRKSKASGGKKELTIDTERLAVL